MVKIVNNENELSSVDKIVIPGVGSFKDAMAELEKDELLKKAILIKLLECKYSPL